MFSEQVKHVRQLLKLSQKEFAQRLGVSFATINRWENSKNIPSQLAQNSFYDFCESNFINLEELKKFNFKGAIKRGEKVWQEQIYYAI